MWKFEVLFAKNGGGGGGGDGTFEPEMRSGPLKLLSLRWSKESTWGFWMLSVCFFFKSISLSKDRTIRFSASNVDISSETSSGGFCLVIIFLLIGSSFS